VISFGDQIRGRDAQGLIQVSPDIITAAADQTVELLTDARLREDVVEHNFQVAERHYSLPALREHLQALMDAFGGGR
jgi:hypothetical protein